MRRKIEIICKTAGEIFDTGNDEIDRGLGMMGIRRTGPQEKLPIGHFLNGAESCLLCCSDEDERARRNLLDGEPIFFLCMHLHRQNHGKKQ